MVAEFSCTGRYYFKSRSLTLCWHTCISPELQLTLSSFAGASRSATYVVAYLMHKYKISPTEALKQIRQNRPQVGPNDNFMQQLELYYTMGMPTNVEESPIYQQWLSKRGQPGQPQDVDKILFEDEHVEQNAESEAALARLRCKNCKYVTILSPVPFLPILFHDLSS